MLTATIPKAKASESAITLRRATSVRRVDALFRAMSSDYLLREQFVTGPSQILAEYLHGRKLTTDEAEPLNHLIYLVMSSGELLRWFRDRAFHPDARTQPQDDFLYELSHAVVKVGDPNLVHALIRTSSTSATVAEFDGVLLSECLRTLTAFADGTEQSTGGGGGTQQSGTHTTEHSTGGGGTRGWVERSAQDLREAFLLRADGTEQSTGGGGGTQQSGTHTTEHSTGGGGTRGWVESVFGNSYARVTLEALAQYTTKLQQLGVLSNPQQIRD